MRNKSLHVGSKTKNILILATKIDPIETGAEICNQKIYDYLLSYGYNTKILTEKDISQNILHTPLCWFSYLRKILNQPAGSLILASSGLEQRIFIPLLVVRLFKIYRIVAISYLIYDYKINPVLKFIYNLMFRLFYSQAHAIIANSSHTKSRLVSFGIKSNKVHIINHGVLNNPSQPSLNLKPNKDGNRTVRLISVGFLEPRKGYHILLKAFNAIPAPVKLMIVGSTTINPKYFGELSQVVDSSQLGDRVIFTGNLPHQVAWNLIAESDIYVHSSLDEGFGISVFEAAYQGKAIIAFNLPVFNEFFQNGVNALLVPTGDITALSQAMLMLINDEAQRRKLGENAAKLPIAHRTWSECMQEIEQVIENTM